MGANALLIDDALELLNPKRPYAGSAFSNTGGRNSEGITTIASFTFPKNWDDGTRWAVTGIIDGAIRRLAKKDRLYDEVLGSAQFERSWQDDDHCHYFQEPGQIAPSLDDVKRYIDTDMRKEFADPRHWIKLNTAKGIKYFIVKQDNGLHHEATIRQAVYHLSCHSPLNNHANMMVMNERPDGTFGTFFENPTIMLPQAPTGPDDANVLKFVPMEPEKAFRRQGIEISQKLAQLIMPRLGVDMRRIKDSPRQVGG